MGAAFEVCEKLGCGLTEEIYQESVELELGWRSIEFSAKSELRTDYKQQRLLNYVHFTKKAVGYLINFGTPKSIEWKRSSLSEYIPDDPAYAF